MRRHLVLGVVTVVMVGWAGLVPATATAEPVAPKAGAVAARDLHLVVIYEENHSFDNLYGDWGPVDGRHVMGLDDATTAHTRQLAQDGTAFSCLLQNDVNLTSPPLAATCSDPAHGVPSSAFPNTPWLIDDYIGRDDTTCPVGGVFAPFGVLDGTGEPGGCTRDLVHRFYQEKYQVNGGKQNRYVTGSDAVGLTMGHYDTRSLPIWRYLHSAGAPNYVIADRFFQAASGGSFLNHQYLIAARAPLDTDPATSGTLNSVVDRNGMPTTYPLYTPVDPVVDGQLTVACADGSVADFAKACGNYAVNTVQPSSAPFGRGARIPLVDDAVYPNIGDRLSAAGVSWNWYSGGWDDAESGSPGPLFQYHHQPFNYFAAYAPGQPGRAHLQDETDFVAAAKGGTLPTVSFVKPYGAENEHPGYASEPNGSDHLVDLVSTIEGGPQADNTLILVTYDEFGGQWDHVSPPGPGSPTRGVYDAFGPGTRIPALVIGRAFPHSGVDHTVYDTTSILATIEHALGLKPVASRDARVPDMARILRAAGF